MKKALKSFAVMALLWAAAAFGQVFTTLYLPSVRENPSASLYISVAAGRVFCGTSMVNYAGGTLLMSASTTNYVYLNTASSCALAVKTSTFVLGDIPIAVVVAGSSTITSVGDRRTAFSKLPSVAAATWGSITGTLSSQTDLQTALNAKAGFPGAGIPKSTGSGWTTPTYADFVALWAGGGCSGYLKNDGTCSNGLSGFPDYFKPSYLGNPHEFDIAAGLYSCNGVLTSIADTNVSGLGNSTTYYFSIKPNSSCNTYSGDFGSFPAGSIPIAIAATDGSGVVTVTDKRPIWITKADSGVQYNPSTTNYFLYGDSRMVVSSSCYVSGAPDNVTISSGSITAGVLTAVTSTNYYATPVTVTLSGFTGGAAGLNGQKVALTSATSTSLVAPVSGISSLGSTGTGAAGCSYNLSGQLRTEPYLNGHGTVINGTIPGLTTGNAISSYPSGPHTYSPAVTGNPGFLIIQVGGQDWLNAGWSLATAESNIQTLLVNARADGWNAIVLTTVIPHNASLYNNPPADILALNTFIKSLVKTAANASTGYADWIEDAGQILPDPTDPTYVLQSGSESGHLTDAGNARWADDLNNNFAAQGSVLKSLPICGPWSLFGCLNSANTWVGVQTFASPVFTGTPDASGATQFKLPIGAAGATLANGEFKYDTTNLNWHGWVNGADSIFLPLASGFTSGHCGQPTKTGNTWYLADAGSSCSAGAGMPAPIFGTGNPFGLATPTIANRVTGSTTFTATSGNTLTVWWNSWDNNDSRTPTLSDTLGSTFTLVATYNNGDGKGYRKIWQAPLTSSGTDAVSITGGVAHQEWNVIESTATSSTTDGWIHGTATTQSITTTAANDLLLSLYQEGGSVCPTVSTGSWVATCGRDSGWNTAALGSEVATTAGTYSVTWSSAPTYIDVLAFKANSSPVAGSEGQLYFDVSTSPYTAYIYHSGSWISYAQFISPLTTKGDLQGYSTVPARVAVGTNGQILSADSTQATGLKWIAAPAGGSGAWTNISGTITPTNLTCGASSCTASAASTITFGAIPSTATSIVIEFNLSGSSLVALRCQLNGDTASTSYAYIGNEIQASANNVLNSISQTSLYCGVATTLVSAGTLKIPFYAITSRPRTLIVNAAGISSQSSGTNNFNDVLTGLWNNTSAAVSSVTIFPASGTITGSFSIYSVQ